jgi:hypothetical protein
MKGKKYSGFLWIVLLIQFPLSIQAQNPTYLCELRNDVQVSSTVFEFDIYLLRTGATPFQYAAGQFGIIINPLIKNGGTITTSIVAGSSDPALIAKNQNPINISFLNVSNCIRIAGRVPPGAGNGAIISNITPGTKVCRVRLTNSVAFGSYSPNLTWTTTTIYPTQINAYVGGLNTAIMTAASQTTNNLTNHILPIELISFEAQCKGNEVSLNWVTASETNNDYFTIQKSRDAENFENITNVDGAGNSNCNQYYSLNDVPYENGITYYRLKQTDFDGEYTYLKTISTDCPSITNNSEYYNLVMTSESGITIQYQTINGASAIIKVYDISGREMETLLDVKHIDDGLHTSTFNFSKSGVYIVEAEINNKIHVNKIVISEIF